MPSFIFLNICIYKFQFFQIMLRIRFPKMFGILIFRCILSRRVCFGLFLSRYSSAPSSIAVVPNQASQPRRRIYNDADGVWKRVLLGDMGRSESQPQKQQGCYFICHDSISFVFCALFLSLLHTRLLTAPALGTFLCFWHSGIFSSFFELWLTCKGRWPST